jgi:hypothetical protein
MAMLPLPRHHRADDNFLHNLSRREIFAPPEIAAKQGAEALSLSKPRRDSDAEVLVSPRPRGASGSEGLFLLSAFTKCVLVEKGWVWVRVSGEGGCGWMRMRGCGCGGCVSLTLKFKV